MEGGQETEREEMNLKEIGEDYRIERFKNVRG